jgi:hypothetical protein
MKIRCVRLNAILPNVVAPPKIGLEKAEKKDLLRSELWPTKMNMETENEVKDDNLWSQKPVLKPVWGASFPHLVTLGLVLDVAAASDDPLVTSDWNKVIKL